MLRHYNIDIDINDAANGVFLPYKKNKYVGNEAMHVGSHSREYYEQVHNYLKEQLENIERSGRTVTRTDLYGLLDDLRYDLLNGYMGLND